jgi:hypothetical protein
MGYLVDRLACFTLNFNQNGTSSKNQPFSRDVCFVKKKLISQKPHENEKEKSR